MLKKVLLVACFTASVVIGSSFSVEESHAGQVDCYSASSGTQEGAWFYDCGPAACPKVDGVHSGGSKSCVPWAINVQ